MKVFGGEKEEKVLLYHPEKFQTILLIIEKGWHLVISLKFCLTRLDKKKGSDFRERVFGTFKSQRNCWSLKHSKNCCVKKFSRFNQITSSHWDQI